ncbi:unnamed protein product [Phaedon cochleariae]|uniref:CRAL-TRIO domain-containing protein n=1 Tax=Phaedon cochleariae TaxID=80249 RepID=A0A9P0DPV6_PHACE|nr:unnamed protein product [Phaedon cochleariae]
MTIEYFHPITHETRKFIWSKYEKTVEGAEQDIASLREWMLSQPHLPDDLSERQIMSLLLLGRGSIEKTKMKIDMYYTMRSLYPDIFENSHPQSQRMKEASKFMYICPLPKLFDKINRVLVLKLKDIDPAGLDPSAVFARLINVVEIRLMEDFCFGHLVIMDMQNCKLGHLGRITPTFVRNVYTIGEKALTTRVIALHIINAPAFVDQTVLIIKSIVKPKLAQKIFVHKDMESVLESLDKDVIPRDYGGHEKSLDELEADFEKKFEEYANFFDQRQKLTVNENLRPAKNMNDEVLGYYGNFKKLDVD